MTDWNPETYERFRGFRLRPPLDLLGRIPELPEGDVIDLGCGSGAFGPALAARYPDRRVIGTDLSPAMLAKAEACGAYDALVQGDIATWRADDPAALIFSNAALQWLGDHQTLLPTLFSQLAKGGMLAVQMPHQNNAPSHCLWGELFASLFPGKPLPNLPGLLEPHLYFRLLSPLGDLQMWETEYYQVLDPTAPGHPVRLFTESTFARAYLEGLNSDEQAKMVKAYDDVVEETYPQKENGTVLFPFRRLFFILTRPQ